MASGLADSREEEQEEVGAGETELTAPFALLFECGRRTRRRSKPVVLCASLSPARCGVVGSLFRAQVWRYSTICRFTSCDTCIVLKIGDGARRDVSKSLFSR